MSKVLSAFVFCLLVWVAVTWAFDPVSLALGVVLAGTIALALRKVELEEAPLLLVPHRLLWALAYIPVLLLYVIRANLDVAWRVLHPKLPIRPGIVRTKTSLKSPGARVLLANSITLTPGTLSVDVEDDIFYVHCIHVPEQDARARVQAALERFEGYLRRIFE